MPYEPVSVACLAHGVGELRGFMKHTLAEQLGRCRIAAAAGRCRSSIS
jgi:hypothetical protein